MRHAQVQAAGSGRAEWMRAEFDAAFGKPVPEPEAEQLAMLRLSLGPDEHLVRLSEVAEVISRPAITSVPSSAPALLGLTCSRGAVLAVYDLAQLIGRSPGPPRWLFVLSEAPQIAMAFERFDGYRRLAAQQADLGAVIELAQLITKIRTLGGAPPDPNRQHGSGG